MTRTLAWLLAAGMSFGGGITSEEARSQAKQDDAIVRLTRVTEIDGVPVDMAGLLDEDGRERVETISNLSPSPVFDRAQVEDTVTRILSDPRYVRDRTTWLQDLLAPVNRSLARIIAYVTDRLYELWTWLVDFLANSPWRWPVIVVGLIAGTVGVWLLTRRRARDIERRAAIERILDLGLDPAELEALASEAAAAGEFAEAIRLRFVAGLLRLDTEGRLRFAPGIPNGVYSHHLASPAFDRLAHQFDEAIYGKVVVSDADHRECLRLWVELVKT